MKTQLLILAAFTAFLFSCQSKESETPSTPLSEQNLEFEIYDSLVVDYLGNLVLMDISPDGNTFLLVDQNTDSIFVTDRSGAILHKYNRTGEGPENIQGNRTGLAKFYNNGTFMIPSSRGIFKYSIDGNLLKSFTPEFTGVSQLTVPSSDAHFVKDDIIYIRLPGRELETVKKDPTNAQEIMLLEALDLRSGDFEPVLPLPKDSKFGMSPEQYGTLGSFPSISLREDTVYLNFRSEPKLFKYALSNLDSPVSIKSIPFPIFIEMSSEEKVERGSFNIRDFFYGTINTLIPLSDNLFLISYLSGLTDDVANEVISEGGTDFDKMFKLGEEKNKGGMILFDGTALSPIIEKPELLGYITKVRSKEEIWFTLNFTEFEKDYSVMYKTKLIQK